MECADDIAMSHLNDLHHKSHHIIFNKAPSAILCLLNVLRCRVVLRQCNICELYPVALYVLTRKLKHDVKTGGVERFTISGGSTYLYSFYFSSTSNTIL